MDYRPIDVDSHVQENETCWTSRMSRATWGDRIPHFREEENGSHVFVNDEKVIDLGMTLQCHSAMPDRETLPRRWDQVPPSVYRADARLKAMDEDGIEAEVLYPNSGGPSGNAFIGKEADFEADCVRAFNDYVADEWLAVSSRFVGLCMLPYSDIERTTGELAYAVGRGHRGPVMMSTPHERGLPHFNDPHWDPLWATAQELGVPVNFHGLGGTNKMRWETFEGSTYRRARALSGGNGYGLQAQAFSNLLFSGILDRFPDLTFVCAESGLGWVPYILETCDRAWQRADLSRHGHPVRPSELFKRQVYIDFWYEKTALAVRDFIGVDRIMWESDFPHPTSLWPNSRDAIENSLGGVQEADRRMILVGNARRAYGLP